MSPVPNEEHDRQDGDDIDNMEAPNLVIPAVIDNSDDEEEEEENDGGNGYQLLPQGPDDVNGNNNIVQDSDDSGMSDGEEEGQDQNVAMATGLVPSGLYPNFPEGELPSYLKVPDLPPPDKREMLWNQPRTASADVLDAGQVASIKNAMKGFHLPSCNIPDWARNISEDKWKERLLSQISSTGTGDNMCSLTHEASSENSHSSDSSLSEPEKETG